MTPPPPPYFPRHEPSLWLRRCAEAAALKIAADTDPHPPGAISLIVPLVPFQPRDRCARCNARSARLRRCGFLASSTHLPRTTLKFTFALCERCAVREYGERATAPQPVDVEEPAEHEEER